MSRKKREIKIVFANVLVLFASQAVWALPQGGISDTSTITTSGSRMHINQTTEKSIINWQSYSIGKNEAVIYSQPSTNSISLNRVVGSDPSIIYGQLSANGRVWVINPNGLLVGKGAKIDVGSFLGSTLNITDNDFLNGKYTFNNAKGLSSSITNLGDITAKKGGYVVLISPTITNKGNISSKLGKAYLASGDKVTLTFANDNLIGFNIDKETANALIKNTGKISANGGEAILSAKSAGDLLKTVINNKGIIEAQTIENRDGKIYLLGGKENNAISVGGTLDASAPNGGDGGFIETSAAKVKVADDAKITTYAPYCTTGEWLIDPQDYTIAASGGDITGDALSSNLNTSNVTIQSSSGSASGNGDINVNDDISWDKNTLTLTAARDININAVMTASGTAKLSLNPATANGGDSAVSGGAVKVGINPDGTFKGRVDFPGRSGTGFLTINGTDYTVINSLGEEGSTTGTDLQGMQGNLSGHYALGSNIDASDTKNWNSGKGFSPVGDDSARFNGTFDGLGHTIKNLTINRPDAKFVGLFGYTNSATIQNIGLINVDVSGGKALGGLVGGTYSSTISNSYATGNVNGNYYYKGGLVGASLKSTISNSYFTGSVKGKLGYTGGLVGSTDSSTISNSYATGGVSGSNWVGGLVGSTGSSTISNSYATGGVSGGSKVGGLVGEADYSTISNSYATGSVSGGNKVGGLVGWANSSTISNSYAIGSVESDGGSSYYTGGLAGYASDSTISNSYATGSVSGGNKVGGLVGDPFSSTISNSYATGSVSGSGNMVGGLVGHVNFSTISNSYYDIESSTINGEHKITIGGIYNNQFNDWLSNGKSLNPSYYFSSDGSYYLISSVSDLKNLLGFYWQKNKFKLTADLDLKDTPNFWIPYFTATEFNGNNHIISNLAINNVSNNNCIGFFGYISNTSIKNLGLTNVNISGNYYVGGLVGHADYSTISNSYFTGSVKGKLRYTGGLVGYAYISTISNSYATGSVSGSYVGGLVGYADSSTISNSYATGSVSGSYVGGLVGYADYSTISNSYATGSVSGNSYVGGFAGDNDGTTFTNDFWDIDTSGTSTGVGDGDSSGVTGKHTAEMKKMATFSDAGWDIANTGGVGTVWRIYEGNTYPLLRSFLKPLTIKANDDTKTYDGQPYSGGNGVTYQGFVNGEDTSVLLGTLTYSGNSQGAKDTGSYMIIPGGLYSNNQQGYDITYKNGTLTINPAPLTIIANPNTKIYDGTTTASATPTVIGTIYGTDKPNFIETYDNKNAGTGKTLIPSGIVKDGNNGKNYSYTFVKNTNGVINPAPLTIKANDMEKTYGDEITFNGTEFTAKGLVNNESIGKVDLTSDGAPKTAPVGTYDIIPSNAQGGTFNPNNYKITYEKGKLNVNPAPSSIRDIYYPIIEENYYIPSSVTNHHKSHYVSLNSANINVEPHWKSNYLIIDKRNIENINYLKIENLTQSTIQGKNKGKLNKGRY